MQVIKPDYYKTFQCIGGDCPDTCCAGWEIMIDEASYYQYQVVPGAFGDHLRSRIDDKEKKFILVGDRCPFLNSSNLCDIYSNIGKEKLCNTCKRYPRHMEDYGNLRECLISISCPRAAQMILGNPNQDGFDCSEDCRRVSVRDADENLLDLLMLVRETIYRYLQNEAWTVRERLGFCLALVHDVQNRIDASKGMKFGLGKLYRKKQIPKVLEHYTEYENYLYRKVRGHLHAHCHGKRRVACCYQTPKAPDLDVRNRKRSHGYQVQQQHFEMLAGLEPLKDNWLPFVEETAKMLFDSMDMETYFAKREVFQAYMQQDFMVVDMLTGEACSKVSGEKVLEHLAVYVTSTYFLGAVFEEDAFTKMKFVVYLVDMMWQLMFARWIKQEETLTFEDMVKVVYEVAREIEHSDDNIKALEMIFANQERFTIEEFLTSMLLA